MLFGGAFDPPHIGHKKIASSVLKEGLADELWFIPAKDHPFSKIMSPAADRIAMLQSIMQPGTKICTYEIEKQGKSYSIETLEHFSKTQPEHEFSWIIGSDQLQSFHKWHRFQDMLSSFRVYVYPRSGYPFEPLYKQMIPLKNMQPIDVSSTEVREKVHRHAPINTCVLPAVSEYIQQHGLYNTSHVTTS